LKKIIILNKKEGETPLEALEKFRNKNKEYKEVPMTYAGRLDPMASGVLLVLIGEECKKKEKYLALSKEYKFQILFGFATDTYDILGKVSSRARRNFTQEVLVKKIKDNLKHFAGKFIQEYPAYSSKTVGGKPLFQYAREGKEVKSPKREVFVKSLRLGKIRIINPEKLFKNIKTRIQKVKGDFRQEEILKIWQKELIQSKNKSNKFYLVDFDIKCGSGTYVRGVANSLGKKIKIEALAFSIKRTKIGKWAK
jgi:tRNA pseudouridine(55) synthase